VHARKEEDARPVTNQWYEPNQQTGLILSSSTIRLLMEGALLPLWQISDASTKGL